MMAFTDRLPPGLSRGASKIVRYGIAYGTRVDETRPRASQEPAIGQCIAVSRATRIVEVSDGCLLHEATLCFFVRMPPEVGQTLSLRARLTCMHCCQLHFPQRLWRLHAAFLWRRWGGWRLRPPVWSAHVEPIRSNASSSQASSFPA